MKQYSLAHRSFRVSTAAVMVLVLSSFPGSLSFGRGVDAAGSLNMQDKKERKEILLATVAKSLMVRELKDIVACARAGGCRRHSPVHVCGVVIHQRRTTANCSCWRYVGHGGLEANSFGYSSQKLEGTQVRSPGYSIQFSYAKGEKGLSGSYRRSTSSSDFSSAELQADSRSQSASRQEVIKSPAGPATSAKEKATSMHEGKRRRSAVKECVACGTGSGGGPGRRR